MIYIFHIGVSTPVSLCLKSSSKSQIKNNAKRCFFCLALYERCGHCQTTSRAGICSIELCLLCEEINEVQYTALNNESLLYCLTDSDPQFSSLEDWRHVNHLSHLISDTFFLFICFIFKAAREYHLHIDMRCL